MGEMKTDLWVPPAPTTPASIDSFTRYHLTAIAVAITRADAVTIATAADRSDARA